MTGAYCLKCRDAGPDLVLAGDDFRVLPPGTEARITFTCGRCGRRWTWVLTKQADGGIAYVVAS